MTTIGILSDFQENFSRVSVKHQFIDDTNFKLLVDSSDEPIFFAGRPRERLLQHLHDFYNQLIVSQILRFKRSCLAQYLKSLKIRNMSLL